MRRRLFLLFLIALIFSSLCRVFFVAFCSALSCSIYIHRFLFISWVDIDPFPLFHQFGLSLPYFSLNGFSSLPYFSSILIYLVPFLFF
jgi:hypothetical protein